MCLKHCLKPGYHNSPAFKREKSQSIGKARASDRDCHNGLRGWVRAFAAEDLVPRRLQRGDEARVDRRGVPADAERLREPRDRARSAVPAPPRPVAACVEAGVRLVSTRGVLTRS